MSFNDLGPDSIRILGPVLGSVVELNLAGTKLNNQSMADFAELYVKQEMMLQLLDLHSNQITTEGFVHLAGFLKSNNKVRQLNLSRNKIGDDPKKFAVVEGFLSCNKVLDVLNLSACGIKPEGAGLIGRALKSNRNLKKLILKGNEVGSGLDEFAQSFVTSTRPLPLKELDLSKCELETEHITQGFIKMLRSPSFTLVSLSLRDNFLKQPEVEQMIESLKINKTMARFCVEFNPVSQGALKDIEAICLRNQGLDEFNSKPPKGPRSQTLRKHQQKAEYQSKQQMLG